MKEFSEKEIDFKVIRLNDAGDKMIEVMKQSHQEVDVVDMTAIREEVRQAKVAQIEAKGSFTKEADLAPSYAEVD